MYAKVFAQIYDGTLTTKGPWEALVTFQQMLVLADQDGNVDMTAGAISRRTTIPLAIIERGIETLIQEDPESRTPTEGGRRIVPLAEGRGWGWRIVNYQHYRALKREEERREYHRTYWHKRKDAVANDTNSLNKTQLPQPNQPIAEAEAEAEVSKTMSQPKGFDTFWKAYPRKQNKPKAITAWRKLKCDEALLQTILEAIDTQKASKQWREGIVPHASTWLNGKRWEDESTSEAQWDYDAIAKKAGLT